MGLWEKIMRQIDWNSAEIVITERDGCDLWGLIECAYDTNGNELTVEELEYWAETTEFYEKLYDRSH